jgi:hypothetical protein
MSGRAGSRVDIIGQFNPDNPLTSWNTEAVVIDRQVALPSVPRSWTTFCADADDALQAITKAKSFYRIFGTLFMAAALAAWVVVILSYVTDFEVFAFSNRNSSFYLLLTALIPTLLIAVVTKTKVSSGMQNVERICQDRSGDGIRYVLCNERWGGCSGIICFDAVRYFVTILVTDAELATDTSTNAASTASLPVATPVSWPTASTSAYTTPAYNPQPSASSAPAPGTSMFDQMAKH